MNRTITMKSGVATLPKSVTPSDEVVAKRLEIFDRALLLEEINTLRSLLADAEEEQTGLHLLYREQIRTLELDLSSSRLSVHRLEEQTADLLAKLEKMTSCTTELESAGNQLVDDKEKLTVEVDRLTAQLNAKKQATQSSPQKDLETELTVTVTVQGEKGNQVHIGVNAPK